MPKLAFNTKEEHIQFGNDIIEVLNKYPSIIEAFKAQMKEHDEWHSDEEEDYLSAEKFNPEEPCFHDCFALVVLTRNFSQYESTTVLTPFGQSFVLTTGLLTEGLNH